MKETKIAVVISEEQGEVGKFRNWELDIMPHRKLIKNGFETADGERIDVESAFKQDGHPFRVAIVCAMWLTGFDVKSLSTLYLDKPLKAHTLMQAIARANRVHEGQEQRSHRRLLRYPEEPPQRASRPSLGTPEKKTRARPTLPRGPRRSCSKNFSKRLIWCACFSPRRIFCLKTSSRRAGFERNATIVSAKEIINQNDETRKHFEIMARAVFQKFKACLNVSGIYEHRGGYDAISIVYKSLQEDRDQADISQIIKELHGIVGESINVAEMDNGKDGRLYDISAIDFERLRQEFAMSPQKNTVVQNLKDAIEKRLALMLARNPLRTDFQQHYENLVAEYNREKDRLTIEQTFEALLKFAAELDEEQSVPFGKALTSRRSRCSTC